MSILDPSFGDKKDVSAIENAPESVDVGNDQERARIDKQTIRRLDVLLLPLVCIIYLLGYIDRANVGNARVVSLD